MIEEEIKDASCQVLADKKSGTGWLISPSHVLTALHTIEGADGGLCGHVTVRFYGGGAARDFEATVLAADGDLDVCLLGLPEALGYRPIVLSANPVRPGMGWHAFGYPAVKLDVGHLAQGTVQQVLAVPVQGIDLDLTVDPETVLSGYEGLSGAALIVDDVCQGIIRIRVDNTLGAVGTARFRAFLESHGVISSSEVDAPDVDLPKRVARRNFDEKFTDCLREGGSGYVLLEGAHGIGKSTYCQTFDPNGGGIDVLGVYAFTDRARFSTPAHQAQPEIFFDWLNSLRSVKSTGRPARLTELSYPQLIEHTARALQELADGCVQSGMRGVLFIDGLNEADRLGGEALQRFIGLLPRVLPTGLKVVLTGVGLDAFSGKLVDIARGAVRLTLPALDGQAQVEICRSTLEGDRATPALIDLLCERALGHPLYLRYLIDLVNGGISDEELRTLPAFSGAIEDYYETIWARLIQDNDVVNLLAIIARLRWSVPTSALMPLLNMGERAVYVSTLARIRHLLSRPEETEIYHPSFSEFVVHKTSVSGNWVQGRLADFCTDTASGDYGVLNRIYHGLLGERDVRREALNACDQTWVDHAVLLEAEPDVLLTDIDDALTIATAEGKAIDIVRLLLLSQRLGFRYNTLFAQSAELVAQALISLGKTKQALRHILRYRTLIVDPQEAFAVAQSMIAAKQYDDAGKILETVERALTEAFTPEDMTWNQFTFLMKLRTHLYVLVEEAGSDPPTIELLKYAHRVVMNPGNGLPVDQQQEIMQAIIGDMLGAAFCLRGSYKPIAKITIPDGVPPHFQATSLIAILLHAKLYSDTYGIELQEAPVQLLLSDIEEKLDGSLPVDDRTFFVVDALIEVGAAPELVMRYAGEMLIAVADIPLFTKNRALADEKAFDDAYRRQRASYFLSQQLVWPVAQLPDSDNWEVRLGTLARSVACHDGCARRAHALNDVVAVNAIREDIEVNLLPVFEFTLKSRIRWDESYFMPEHVMPWLYQHLVRLYIDCFGASADALFALLKRGFGEQLGLYNEGFRRALEGLIEPIISADKLGGLEDTVFDAVVAWRDYTLKNVENRHELVPELLKIVSLLARIGAPEEALRTYRSVLAVSMGPGWYKEDQLSLMSETLAALSLGTAVDTAVLAQIAANLERATGEMTFRRYVRADKGSFIGELCRRGLSAGAVRYFQHQSCGTNQQLFDQVAEGELDRVSPFVGMRFPGGSLEEQAALLQFVKHVDVSLGWRIRWALLESYLQGDDRYLDDWGLAYANIINRLVDHPLDLAWACNRIKMLSLSMSRERAWLLLQALMSRLEPAALTALGSLFEKIEGDLSEDQVDRISSNFGVRRRRLNGLRKDLDKQVTQVTKPSVDVGEPESGDEDGIWMPGTFGRRSALQEAEGALEASRKHLKRRNSAEAIACSLEALRALQRGEWSVWDHLHSAGEADRILKSLIPDGDALARAYGDLAIEERHTQRWQVASRLIQLTSSGLDAQAQADMLDVAIDHVGLLVGAASTNPFTYIGNEAHDEDTPPALELLLWTLDHPSWERRDGAASMLLWLLRTEDTWIQPVVRLMVSRDPRYRADVATGALDVLSKENPLGLWSRIVPYLEMDALPDQVAHVSRYAALIRVADRAGRQGDGSAAKLARALEARLPISDSSDAVHASPPPPTYFPSNLLGVWKGLSEIGMLDSASVKRFAAALATACLPLSIEDCHALELSVSQGFRERLGLLDRWECKVRHALCVAIFPDLSLDALRVADAILRTCNPESLVEPPAELRPTSRLIDALIAGDEDAYQPSDHDFVYLHMQCMAEIDKKLVHVELIPELIAPGSKRPSPVSDPAFLSTEIPDFPDSNATDVCGRVRPIAATFGSLTPAIVAPQFLALIGADPSACVRHHWRDGSTATVMSPVQSRVFEHALLAVRRAAFDLPPGWRLAWSLRVSGKYQTTLTRY
ncbi:AVAST type 1 anti-phage system protease Avs1b [Xanthomonas campestris pv. raphani]|uniref:AVAST type 1 anti-phage system protease Avs1b n=1 Tax=Xanthomonas campestris TaxID=339 RepID=UPI002B221F10|nr:AVAST type 1 anti-phage system protease Avs1b [Xanthomonas campestris]MEA9830473.1 AVAST type 1 anti-phage system protease Avs1b [Xanthomonas campestris pv. raphani]MEA9951450.1 AVAST type 1 anti-phage system protease Avs1b [Xanthomonas campestris pv. raphani]